MKVILFILTFFLNSVFAISQITIVGKITNNKNMPIQYANVWLQHSNIGTVTNNNGEYILNIKKESLPDTLIFSYIGYKTVKRKLVSNKNKITLNIILEPFPQVLQEIAIKSKAPEPAKIFKKACDNFLKLNNQKFLATYYIRETIKYKQKYIFNAEGILKGVTGNLWNKSKLLYGKRIGYDSLLYLVSDTPQILDFPFEVLVENMKKVIKKLTKNKNVILDTAIIGENSKIYVINVGNIDIELYNSMTYIIDDRKKDSLLFYFAEKQRDKSFYKFFIEVRNNIYKIKKIEKLIPFLSKNNKSYDFIKEDYYYNNDGLLFHKTFFMTCYENDTTLYSKFSEYLITKIENINKVKNKEEYKSIYSVFPTYALHYNASYLYSINKEISKYNNPDFNYIKQDTLEYLINRDLK